MWRQRIAGVRTPLAIAASMNSRRRRLSVWPRTMRAMVSQPTAPMAMNSAAMLPRANSVDRMITKKMYGSAYTMSTKRIIARVDAAAEIARGRAPGDADADADQRGQHADEQRDAHRLHAAREQVAAEPVRAEPVRRLRAAAATARCCQSRMSWLYGVIQGASQCERRPAAPSTTSATRVRRVM